MWCFRGKPAWTDRLWYVQHSARGSCVLRHLFLSVWKALSPPFPKGADRTWERWPHRSTRGRIQGWVCLAPSTSIISYLIWFFTCQTEGFILSFIQQIFEHRHCISGHTEHSSWTRCWGLNRKTGLVCFILVGKKDQQPAKTHFMVLTTLGSDKVQSRFQF